MNIFPIASFVLYIGIPGFFFIRMWRNYSRDFGMWILETTLYGAYIGNMYLTGFWAMNYGWYTRYALVFLFIIIAVKSFFNIKRGFKFKSFGAKKIISYITILFVDVVLVAQFFVALGWFFCPSSFSRLRVSLKRR